MRSDDELASLLYPHLTNRKAAVAVANPTATRAEIEKKLAREPEPQLEEEGDPELEAPEIPAGPGRRPAPIIDAFDDEVLALIAKKTATIEAQLQDEEAATLRRDYEERETERRGKEGNHENGRCTEDRLGSSC